MPILVPRIPFIRRRRRPPIATPTPPALSLVAASYDPSGETVTLSFDRAIDIAGLDGTQIVVGDGLTNLVRYDGTIGATLLSPTQVRLALGALGSFSDPVVLLDATASNGIVAVDDGGTWAGIVWAALPFP